MPDDLIEEDSHTEAKEKGRRNTSYAIVGTIAIFAIIGWLTNFYFASVYDWGDRNKGEFGDIFGVINSLFTGLAFIGVVWSVSTQREELAETRRLATVAIKELERTQTILDKQEENIASQNAANTKQMEANAKQMFEATFFQLLSAFNRLVASISLERKAEQTPIPNTTSSISLDSFSGKGAEVFSAYIDEIRYLYASTKYTSPFDKLFEGAGYEYELNRKRYRDAYREFYNKHRDSIARYFRALYTLLQFIDKATISQDDKYFYAKLIRTDLSNAEATLLAMNFASGRPTTDFSYLVSKYGTAKNADMKNYVSMTFASEIPDGIYGQKYVRLRNIHGYHPTTENYQSFNPDYYDISKSEDAYSQLDELQ